MVYPFSPFANNLCLFLINLLKTIQIEYPIFLEVSPINWSTPSILHHHQWPITRIKSRFAVIRHSGYSGSAVRSTNPMFLKAAQRPGLRHRFRADHGAWGERWYRLLNTEWMPVVERHRIHCIDQRNNLIIHSQLALVRDTWITQPSAGYCHLQW